MQENYTYPAVLDINEPGFVNITIPAFQAVTAVEAGEDPVAAAQDLLTLEILDREETGAALPPADGEVTAAAGQRIVYVNVWMPYHRSKVKEVYVKKTLTIPAWLDMLAKENNLNFSATLTEALKEKLHLSRDV